MRFFFGMVHFDFLRVLLLIALMGISSARTEEKSSPGAQPPAASLTTEEIRDFGQYPERVQSLLRAALALSTRKLGYTYGSASPDQGGMDCSGTIYYLLREAGFTEVPRSSSEQYGWVRKAGNFRAVVGTSMESFELKELAPGDLLFWTGTYDVDRDPPVTHTMIYLGKAKSDGLPLMFGSSDGRTYRGKKQWGVGVFEFRIPRPTKSSPARFVGYSRIPGL